MASVLQGSPENGVENFEVLVTGKGFVKPPSLETEIKTFWSVGKGSDTTVLVEVITLRTHALKRKF